MNLPTNEKYYRKQKKNIDFAAILTGKEEIPEVDTLDTALATFQSTKRDESLNFSVKVTDTEKIKEVHIDIGKPQGKGKEEKKEKVVVDLYKSKTPTGKVMGNLCEGNIKSRELKGPLRGKNTKDLINKIETGEAYVDMLTDDNPDGKVRGKIKKLAHTF